MFNLRKLLAFFAAEPVSAYDAALRHLAHGRPQTALEMLDRQLDGETDAAARARIENKRGVALIALRRREEAQQAFVQACDSIPEFAPALVNLGNLELEAGACDAALSLYRRALQNDERYAPAYRHMGLAYKRMGRSADAFQAFSKARRLEGRAPAKPSKQR